MTNIVRFPNAGIPPLDEGEWFMPWLDEVRQAMTNGQPWQPAVLAARLRDLSRRALEMAYKIERVGNVPRRRRFVVRRASKRTAKAGR